LPVRMVNFHDPAVIAQDFAVLTKLWHTMAGLYIWEFVTTLEYEWDIIRGRLSYQWTIWIYSLTRVSALSGVILGLIILNNTGPINCQAAISFMSVFSFLTLSASTLLIALRVIAIWNKNRVAVAMSIGAWAINAGLSIQGVARLRSRWSPEQLACIPSNTDSTLLTFISILVADLTLLLVMLVGLFRLRRHRSSTVGFVEHLWRQGVIWLLLATVAEVPPVVFIVLNLNAPLNIIFQETALLMMAIAGTRMYRSLVDFTSSSTDVFTTDLGIRNGGPLVQETKRIDASSIPISQVGVATDIVFERHVPSSMVDYNSHISTDEQTREKPEELSLDGDVERGV